ncbi:MAG: alpha-L-arabinofuranosidase, partial [Flavisolibacter sp.]|nr:alpha-L-arabinofuranosidase [Flavisolibacter sp.]
LQNVNRYDNYDRNGSKVFAGEYAAQSDRTVSVNNKNNWRTAMSEAAFMTGMERNADVVVMASYAPLFAHIEGWQWTPDMIWVDNLRSYGTPNYYTQKLFSVNKGTHIVPILRNNQMIAGQDSLYASATLDKKTNDVIIKIVNASGKSQNNDVVIDGVKKLSTDGVQTVLRGENLEDVNSFTQPGNVSPVDQKIKVNGKKLSLSLAPYSLNVIRVKMM